MKYMNSYPKILGTIFAIGILVIGIAPLINSNNQAVAFDFNVSDFNCIAVIGKDNCNIDNSSTEVTTTNNVDNSTTNIDNSTTNNIDNRSFNTTSQVGSVECTGTTSASINQEGNEDTATTTQTLDFCRDIGSIVLPN